MSDDPVKKAYDTLMKAAEAYVEANYPGRIMTGAVMLYEVGRMDEEGNMNYQTSYTLLTEGSVATAVGISILGTQVLRAALMPDMSDEEDSEGTSAEC